MQVVKKKKNKSVNGESTLKHLILETKFLVLERVCSAFLNKTLNTETLQSQTLCIEHSDL